MQVCADFFYWKFVIFRGRAMERSNTSPRQPLDQMLGTLSLSNGDTRPTTMGATRHTDEIHNGGQAVPVPPIRERSFSDIAWMFDSLAARSVTATLAAPVHVARPARSIQRNCEAGQANPRIRGSNLRNVFPARGKIFCSFPKLFCQAFARS